MGLIRIRSSARLLRARTMDRSGEFNYISRRAACATTPNERFFFIVFGGGGGGNAFGRPESYLKLLSAN